MRGAGGTELGAAAGAAPPAGGAAPDAAGGAAVGCGAMVGRGVMPLVAVGNGAIVGVALALGGVAGATALLVAEPEEVEAAAPEVPGVLCGAGVLEPPPMAGVAEVLAAFSTGVGVETALSVVTVGVVAAFSVASLAGRKAK